MGRRTFYLFARPSFLDGMVRIVDVAGALNTYNDVDDDNVNDAIALKADFAAVSDEIRTATARASL